MMSSETFVLNFKLYLNMWGGSAKGKENIPVKLLSSKYKNKRTIHTCINQFNIEDRNKYSFKYFFFKWKNNF